MGGLVALPAFLLGSFYVLDVVLVVCFFNLEVVVVCVVYYVSTFSVSLHEFFVVFATTFVLLVVDSCHHCLCALPGLGVLFVITQVFFYYFYTTKVRLFFDFCKRNRCIDIICRRIDIVLIYVNTSSSPRSSFQCPSFLLPVPVVPPSLPPFPCRRSRRLEGKTGGFRRPSSIAFVPSYAPW